MKLRLNETSTPPQTSKAVFYDGAGWVVAPTPPTPEAVERAQFVDKTYKWKGN